MPRESHALGHADGDLDAIERIGLALFGAGLLLLALSLLPGPASAAPGPPSLWLAGAWAAVAGGGLAAGLRKHLRDLPGVRNHRKTADGLTARGGAAWLLAVVFTLFYVLLYWHPAPLEGLIRLHDPLSQLARSKPADRWFVYGTFYTAAVLVMGAKALAKYRHTPYQIARTCSIIAAQLGLAYLLPALLAKLNEPEVYLSYLWPLAYDRLFPSSLADLAARGGLGHFFIGWFVLGTVAATPALTYFFGKRWYCSWVCGCGGLANTLGDPWRHLSDKSLAAWKLERWTVHAVLAWILLLTALLWMEPLLPRALAGPLYAARQCYAFAIGAAFAGVIGVGAYPIFGTRVWCRFGCPMAALLGLIQRFRSRFRITSNGAQCISCGNCSTYCEMGIDVRWYAQRGQDVVRASCVGCGLCATVCPRGVLRLENGPGKSRNAVPLSMLAGLKSRPNPRSRA